uniref:Viral histone-like protein n=1 Tax=Myoviridae sp. ctA1z6 TaxID=2826627 RepID=A0A8S5M923_9CAUD|nr:MAG TPA: DNA binding protein [Myoviridae sp. ctA1z6]
MTKAELIEKVHCTSGESKAVVERVLDGLCGVMETEFKDGGLVALPGIGKLYVKTTKARKGRNPRTGEALMLPAGRRMAFTAAKGLKAILKG